MAIRPTAYAGIQIEVADKLLWLIEAGHAANRGLHRQRDGHVNTGNGHQPLHAVILKSRAGKIALDDLEVLAQPIELAQMPIDSEALVFRHNLFTQPGPTLGAAQVRMRTRRDQVKDRLDDVLQTRSLPDDLIAPSDLPAQRLRRLVRNPDFWQEAAGIEQRFYYESHDQLRIHLADFVAAYNFARRLKTLKGRTRKHRLIDVAKYGLQPRWRVPSIIADPPLGSGLISRAMSFNESCVCRRICKSLIISRIAFSAEELTAGVKPQNSRPLCVPHTARGRKQYPRKSNVTFGCCPLRLESLQ